MTLFVYTSQQCQQDAETYGLTSYLNDIRQRIEAEQALWGLSAFYHPFWVKKRFGNRHTRLICRIESHTVGAEVHDVLVLMSVMQRGDRRYTQLFLDIKREGEALYHDCIAPHQIMPWLNERLSAPDVPQKHAMSDAEAALLYSVRNQHQHTEQHIQQEMLYDAWSWVEKSQLVLTEPDWQHIAARLAEVVGHHQEQVYPLGNFGEYQVLFWHHPVHRFGYLTIESLTHAPAQLSDRHVSLADLQAYAQETDPNALKMRLCQSARRAYPLHHVLDQVQWLRIQHDHSANLALSPEEAYVLSHTQEKERPFPLFINGRAGSGKSTILQYLFADYVYANTQHNPPVPLIYFSCSRTLVERAGQTIHQVLAHSCRYDDANTLTLAQVQRYCAAFRDYLLTLLPDEQRGRFASSQWIGYGRFRRIWQEKFGHLPASRRLSADLCWHVIRSFIKGRSEEDWLDLDDYKELHDSERTLDEAVFADIEKRIWLDWYLPLCKSEGYWDDQDLAHAVLDAGVIKPTFAAIFCDESQDFTRLELQIILRLSLYTDRLLQPHEIQRVPLVFAGDQFQTLNPTGFRWESVKAQVMEQFVFALDPAKHSQHNEMNYQELSFNFRSAHPIAKFSNVVHGLRARRMAPVQLRPQQCWHLNPNSRDVVFVERQDRVFIQQLQRQRDLVVVLPCHDGQEYAYIQQDAFLTEWLKPQQDGTTTVPTLSVITAKGLEFERVVMVGFAADCPDEAIETLLKPAQHAHIGMEYFLNKLYVAVTRARSQLFVVDSRQDYHQFWQHFEQPCTPPLSLDQLERPDHTWLPHVGQLRRANLEDLTPDADQVRNMQLNAEQFAQQGRELGDSRLLRQAAVLYEQLGLTTFQQSCLADAHSLSGEYVEAAQLYAAIGSWTQAFEHYWRAGCWADVQALAKTHSTLNNRPEALVARLLYRPQLSLQSCVTALQQLQHMGLAMPAQQADQQTWRSAFGLLIPRLAIDEDVVRWAQLLPLLRWLNQIEWLTGVVSDSVFAHVAYCAGDMQQACDYWDLAHQHDRVTPPHPLYQQAIIQTRQFPDTVDALLELGQKDALFSAFCQYPALETLPVSVWRSVLPTLRSDTQRHQNTVQYSLVHISQLDILDELIEEIGKVRVNSRWLHQAQAVRMFKATLQLDWHVILPALARNLTVSKTITGLRASMLSRTAKARQKRQGLVLDDTQSLLLNALSICDVLVTQAQDMHDSDDISSLINLLNQLFKVTEVNRDRSRKSFNNGEVSVWRIDFDEVKQLGAVLERSHHFVEMLTFYERLKHHEQLSEYAQARWLVCKYRQAADFERMQADFERKAKAAVELKRRNEYTDKARDAKNKAERAYASAEEHRQRINISQAALSALPDYPVLLDAQTWVINCLELTEPVVLLPILPVSCTAVLSNEAEDVTPVDDLPPADITLDSSLDSPPDVSLDVENDATINEVIDLQYSDMEDVNAPPITSIERPSTHEMMVDQPVLDLFDTQQDDENQNDVNQNDVNQKDDSQNDAYQQNHRQNDDIQNDVNQHAVDGSTLHTAPDHVIDTVLPLADQTMPVSCVESVVQDELAPQPTQTSDGLASQHTIMPMRQTHSTHAASSVAYLPRTECVFMDYRIVLVRQTRRLNIEQQQTGQCVSIHLDQQHAVGDWTLTAHESGTWRLEGTPWLLCFNGQTDCSLSWPAYGLTLSLQV